MFSSRLWRPVTYGEELFLQLYDAFGAQVQVAGPEETGLQFLVNERAFNYFTALSATSEVFFRCVRAAADVYRNEPRLTPFQFASRVRVDLDLPARLGRDEKFGERIKQVGQIVVDRRRDKSVEKAGTREEPNECYLCGLKLSQSGHTKRSIEHVWPLSLGGETVEDNLVLACTDCNSKRGNTMLWAHGPVSSTFFQRSSSNPVNPPADLRLSLALARLLQAAAPATGRGGPLTLKGAIRKIRPAIPSLEDVNLDKPLVYFELLQEMQVNL